MEMSFKRMPAGSDSHHSVTSALYNLARHPYETLCRRWNWKCALLSATVRGLIFFFVNIVAGLRAAVWAMLIEFVFRALTAGFYGAMTQAISRIQPGWAAAACAVVLLPIANHVPEFVVHWIGGTEKLAGAVAASAAFTVISTLFNLYAMRNGALIVGPERRSLTEDLKRMPRMVIGFVCVVPLALWRLARSRSSRQSVEVARGYESAD
jgi:hypothetical protein